MFENIIGHSAIISQLTEDTRSKTLPASLLFTGPAYTGKLSTALELARVLGCTGKGEWNCSCSSCHSHRYLTNTDLLFAGSRYFLEDIAAAAYALQNTERAASWFLFLRSVRKLTRRFDPVMWEGNESRLSKIRTPIQALEETIDGIDPFTAEYGPEKIGEMIDSVQKNAQKIVSSKVLDNISVDQIRKIRYWAHRSGGSNKSIIIEKIEKLLPSAQNGLLKILEEPPRGITFILIAQSKTNILSTIKSRVREYSFQPRKKEEEHQVLEKIFRGTDFYSESLRDFFLAWSKENRERISEHAVRFIESVLEPKSGREVLIEEAQQMLEDLAKKNEFDLFLEEIIFLFERLLKKGGTGTSSWKVSIDRLSKWIELIHSAKMRVSVYNIAPSLVLESLFYSMREVV
ncbi:MAG: hypothetical protein ACLFR1_08395 [Spirochaetia bacterium]